MGRFCNVMADGQSLASLRADRKVNFLKTPL